MSTTDVPDELPLSELQALQGELAGLMTGIRKFHRRLRQVTQTTEERTLLLEAKVEELEEQNLGRALEIRQFEQEREELLRTLEAKTQELARVARERDDAVQELLNARRSIEDLLVSHQQATDAPDEASRRMNKHINLVPAKKLQHPQREITVESDDESTVRPPHSVARAPEARVDPAPAPETRRNHRGLTKAVARPPSQEIDATTTSVITDTQKTPTSVSTGKQRLSWYLELQKQPATSLDVFPGPIPFNVLADNLVLDDDMVDEIHRLEYAPGYDIRLHTEADLAFVYRPVILEGLVKTYLIGWGDASMVRRVRDWSKDIDDVNLFFCPAIEKSGWYYLGKHKLTYAPIESVWGKLVKEDKVKLLEELKVRNPDMDASQFKRDVRDGRLVQCCIQLENVGNKVRSLEFLREYGLLPGDGRNTIFFEDPALQRCLKL